jgi:hypothetical protein
MIFLKGKQLDGLRKLSLLVGILNNSGVVKSEAL